MTTNDLQTAGPVARLLVLALVCVGSLCVHAVAAERDLPSRVPASPSTRPATQPAPDRAVAEGGFLYLVGQGAGWGYVDQWGRMAIAPQFWLAGDFDDAGFAIVGYENRADPMNRPAAVINRRGELVLRNGSGIVNLGRGRFGLKGDGGVLRFVGLTEPFNSDVRCTDVRRGSEGLIAVQIDGKWGFMDDTGKLAIPAKYDWVFAFSEGLAAVSVDRQVGFINHSGEWAIMPQFRVAAPFSEGMGPVRVGDVFRFIDHSGQQAIATDYRYVSQFSEGLAAVRGLKSDLWGYIDKKGAFQILPKFDHAGDFAEGLACVSSKAEHRSGYINHAGELVISFPTDKAVLQNFHNGRAQAEVGDLRGLIDKSGTWVWCTPKDAKRKSR